MSLSDKDREWIQKSIVEAFAESHLPKKKKKHRKKNAFKNCAASFRRGKMPTFHGYLPPPDLHSMNFREIEEYVHSLGIRSQISEDMQFSWDEVEEKPYKL
ncbi:MAG: hypothetical protein H6861_01005 [Rhodospirillales bacterium]|nr:hypothetical protein [Rhodospirillales bacterium]